MEGLNMGSPTFQFVYGDAAEQLFDTSNGSSPQSPLTSPDRYDLSYMADFGPEVYPSPEHDAGTPETQATTTPPPAKTPAKRKRENRYKNAPPSVLSRRRAQNRASQRAYRERKDQRIKDLEHMLGEAKQRNETLTQAYAELHAEYVKLKTAAAQANATTAMYPTVGLANNDRIDMDLYVYPADMSNYGSI